MDLLKRCNPLARATGSLRRRPGAFIVSVVFLVIPLGAFLLWPILQAIKSGFVHDGQASLYWLGRVGANEILLGQMRNGIVLACITTMGCLILAVPLAILRARCSFIPTTGKTESGTKRLPIGAIPRLDNGQSKRIARMVSIPSRQTKNLFSTQNNPPDSRSQRDTIVAVSPRHSSTNWRMQQVIFANSKSASHLTRPTVPTKPYGPTNPRNF